VLLRRCAAAEDEIDGFITLDTEVMRPSSWGALVVLAANTGRGILNLCISDRSKLLLLDNSGFIPHLVSHASRSQPRFRFCLASLSHSSQLLLLLLRVLRSMDYYWTQSIRAKTQMKPSSPLFNATLPSAFSSSHSSLPDAMRSRQPISSSRWTRWSSMRGPKRQKTALEVL
jgi:hypothetical protein